VAYTQWRVSITCSNPHFKSNVWDPRRLQNHFERSSQIFLSVKRRTHSSVVVNTVRSQVPEFASSFNTEEDTRFLLYNIRRDRAPNMVIGDTGHEWECSRKSRLSTNALYISTLCSYHTVNTMRQDDNARTNIAVLHFYCIFIVNLWQAAYVEFISSDVLGWCFSLFIYADVCYILVGRCLGLVLP